MLLQDLLVATVLLEQMDNYAKKKIFQFHHKRKHTYTPLVFFELKIWCLLCISEIPDSNLSSETSYLS